MNIISKFALFCFLLTISIQASFAKLLMKPYLQSVTPNSITVMVETDTKDPVTVIYGKDELRNQAMTSFLLPAEDRRSETYVHRVVLSSLEPNSIYQYRAIHNGDTSALFSFNSYKTEGQTFRVGLAGDNRSNPEVHSRVSKKLLQKNPHFLLYSGDLCYSGKYFEWKDEFFTEPAQNLYATTPFYNSLGNHEAQTNLYKVFLNAPEAGYYSFDYGNAHFLILNTEADVSPNSQQWKFAENDLSQTKKKWKIVVFHIPAYSSGGHNGNKKMQEFTSRIFEKYGVDLILNGHNHFYQRSFVNGIYHLVFGGGGAPLYTPKEAPFVQKSIKDYHYGIMDVTESSIKILVYDLRDNVIDEIEIKK